MIGIRFEVVTAGRGFLSCDFANQTVESILRWLLLKCRPSKCAFQKVNTAESTKEITKMIIIL